MLKESDVLEVIDKHWGSLPYKKQVISTLLLCIVEIFLLGYLATPKELIAVAFIVTGIAISIYYWRKDSLPKTKPGKIGFVVSIACDEINDAKEIRAEFIYTLRNLLMNGKDGTQFQFIEIPIEAAKTITDNEHAEELRKKTEAHFILFGRVKLGKHNKTEHYFIELNGAVRHNPVHKIVSEQFAKEFSEILPRSVAIPKDADLLAFRITPEWTEIAAKYIIGIAAAISGDINYAETLYRNVLERIGNNNGIPALTLIRNRIPQRISELYLLIGNYHLARWMVSKEAIHMDKLDELLLKNREFDEYIPNLLILNAICQFVKHGNIDRAIEFHERCPKSMREATWYFNMAFLYAYKGDLNKTYRQYQKGLRERERQITPESVGNIEDFLLYFATLDGEKYQIYYCLGFFNKNIKGDLQQAKNDFEKFLAKGDESRFFNERNWVRKWMAEIDVALKEAKPHDHS